LKESQILLQMVYFMVGAAAVIVTEALVTTGYTVNT